MEGKPTCKDAVRQREAWSVNRGVCFEAEVGMVTGGVNIVWHRGARSP